MKFPCTMNTFATRMLAIFLSLLLCGAPQLLAQSAPPQNPPPAPQPQSAPSQSDGQAAPPQQPLPQSGDPQAQPQSPPRNNQPLDVDPSKGPLQPAQPADDQLPNAPSSTQPAPAAAAQTPQPQSQQKKTPAEAQGTAVAGEAKTAGGPASKPAGTAIAPAKQRQVHSLLIKLGLIAAGGAAIGTIYGLTRSTSSTPPNATAAGTTQAH